MAAKGHTWYNGNVTREPTETTEGIKTYTCTICGKTRTESIPTIDHVHHYESVVTAPTCTEGGYTTCTCACGDSYRTNETAPLGHAMDEWVVTKAPTSETEGLETRTCSRCGHKEERTVAVLDNPFHDVP